MARMGRVPYGRTRLDWQDDAACQNIPSFLELPEHGGWTDKERKQVCNGYRIGDRIIEPRCPVINECLTYALTLPATEVDHMGLVFGGYTGRQLARKIRDNKRKNAGVR